MVADKRYAYCDGEPVNRADPSGLDWIWSGTNWQEIPDSPHIDLPRFKGTKTGETWPVTIVVAASNHPDDDQVEIVAKQIASSAPYGFIAKSKDEFIAGVDTIIKTYIQEGKIPAESDFKIRELKRYGHASAGVGGGEVMSNEEIMEMRKYS